MNPTLKVSSPSTHEFWEIPILFEDEHLLALDKPSGLLASPDRYAPELPNLLKLLHLAIEQGKPWVRERGYSYLSQGFRLEAEASGVWLLARTKPVLITLADLFGSDQARRSFITIVQGAPRQDRYEIDLPLATHPTRPGLYHIDRRLGKQAKTQVEVMERFDGYALVRCWAHAARPHQVRLHLQAVGLSVAGDRSYGGRPLLLSRLKGDYRLKPEQIERPLLGQATLLAEKLEMTHPVTSQPLVLEAAWPKDLTVAVKYLRRYAVSHAGANLDTPASPEPEGA